MSKLAILNFFSGFSIRFSGICFTKIGFVIVSFDESLLASEPLLSELGEPPCDRLAGGIKSNCSKKESKSNEYNGVRLGT